MKTNQFLKWLPSSFILIGIGLWMNSLCFSPITNSYEMDLKKDWTLNYERGNSFLDSINAETQVQVTRAVLRRPDDEIILNSINEILSLKEKKFKRLDEKKEQLDTSIHAILTDFKNGSELILKAASEKHPLVTADDITNLLKYISFRKRDYYFNDAAFLILTQKQQILHVSTDYIQFFSKKIGGACCFGDFISPSISVDSNIFKKGIASQSKVFLMYQPCVPNTIMSNLEYKIDGKEIEMIHGAASYEKTFKSTIPQTLQVETEYETHDFERRKIARDTSILRRDFTIYPIN